MKTLILTLIILFGGFGFAQVQDSLQARKGNQEQVFKNDEAKMRIGSKEEGQQRTRKKDVFVDKDGDGICDTRQGGMSFGRMRQRMGEGKKGPDGSGTQNRYGGGGRK
jgi:hypothetical protein